MPLIEAFEFWESKRVEMTDAKRRHRESIAQAQHRFREAVEAGRELTASDADAASKLGEVEAAWQELDEAKAARKAELCAIRADIDAAEAAIRAEIEYARRPA